MPPTITPPSPVGLISDPGLPNTVELPIADTVGKPLQEAANVFQTIFNTLNPRVDTPKNFSPLLVQLIPDDITEFKSNQLRIGGYTTLIKTLLSAISSALNLDFYDLGTIALQLLLTVISGSRAHFNYKYRTNIFD